MFSDPEKIMSVLSLKDGMAVADLGAGAGAFSFACARRIASYNGKVYAIEVQKNLLERIKSEAREKHITNIEILWADIENRGGTKLKDSCIDVAIVANVLFQIENTMGFLDEISRILKPKGEVLLVEWSDSFGGMGPAPEMVVTEEKARALFAKKGFKVVRDIPAGSHHYGLLLQR